MELIKQVTVVPVTVHDEIFYKDTPVLKFSITYPKFISKQYPNAAEKMNAFYEKKAREYEQYIREVLFKSAVADYENSLKNGYPVHEYEAVVNFTLTYNQSCGVSLYSDQYEYTGGAHGNTIRTSQTWSLNDGRQIPLKELFPGNPAYQAQLKAIIKKQIAEDIRKGNNDYFENYQELVDNTFSLKNYYLTPKALIIYFQQYDIAPYSSGIPTFSIPYSEVGAQLPHCR